MGQAPETIKSADKTETLQHCSAVFHAAQQNFQSSNNSAISYQIELKFCMLTFSVEIKIEFKDKTMALQHCSILCSAAELINLQLELNQVWSM